MNDKFTICLGLTARYDYVRWKGGGAKEIL